MDYFCCYNLAPPIHAAAASSLKPIHAAAPTSLHQSLQKLKQDHMTGVPNELASITTVDGLRRLLEYANEHIEAETKVSQAEQGKDVKKYWLDGVAD
eukprot:356791-Chlamydomonas_euryale.AAC.3